MSLDTEKQQDTQSPLPFSDDAISGAIGKIMEHPELISMVASALGKSTARSEEANAPDTPPDNSEDATKAPNTDAIATLLPMLNRLSSAEGGIKAQSSSFSHAPLLLALKPYVSQSRCQAIDYIIRISQISGLIGKLR